MSREEFKRITSNLVQKTLSYVDVVLQRNFDCVIDTVLLVGGSTYMPMIREAVENKFPGKVQQHKPDCAVAMGAAIYGGYLEKELIKKSEFIDGCIEDEDEVFLKNQLERTQERLKEIEREKNIIESQMGDMQEKLSELEKENVFLKKVAVYFAKQIDFNEVCSIKIF